MPLKINVEMTIQEGGLVNEKQAYLRDSEMELADLLEWTKTQLIVVADSVLREEQDKGFDKEPILLVDGRRGKHPKDVSPFGQIEFVARQQMSDMIRETYVGLMRRSPVKTGRYIASHFVFHNGIQVANDYSRLERWLATNPEFNNKDTVRIVNIQPYARRLELLGVTSSRTQMRREDRGRRHKKKTGTLVKLPNGAYQLTVRAIKAKFKQNSIIRFTFLPGSSLGLSGTFKGGRGGKNSSGRPYLYPTIVFTVQERGIL